MSVQDRLDIVIGDARLKLAEAPDAAFEQTTIIRCVGRGIRSPELSTEDLPNA